AGGVPGRREGCAPSRTGKTWVNPAAAASPPRTRARRFPAASRRPRRGRASCDAGNASRLVRAPVLRARTRCLPPILPSADLGTAAARCRVHRADGGTGVPFRPVACRWARHRAANVLGGRHVCRQAELQSAGGVLAGGEFGVAVHSRVRAIFSAPGPASREL